MISQRITECPQRDNYLKHLENLKDYFELFKKNKLNFDSAIKRLPEFKGLPNHYLNIYEKKCNFVFNHIEDIIANVRSIVL